MVMMNKQEIENAIYELGKFATGETYDTEYTDLSIFDLAISAIEQQLTNGWILCKDRMPEEDGYYLTTYHEWCKGEYLPEFDFTREKILRFYRGEFKMPVCCNDKIEQDIGREVLAWRELPKIWRG